MARKLKFKPSMAPKTAEHPIYLGSLDILQPKRVAGWAIKSDALPAPAKIAVLREGRPMHLMDALLCRQDVAAAGHPTCMCGFDFAVDIPPHLIVSGAIEVTFWENDRATYRITTHGIADIESQTPQSGRLERILYPHRDDNPSLPSILIEGPVCGDYSLAIVNRNFAHALIKNGCELSIYSSERDVRSDFYFNASTEISQFFVDELDTCTSQIHSLFTWPPETSHMRTKNKIIHCYNWEESVFPPKFVIGFNRDVQLITAASLYTKISLENSGVTVPIVVAGLGVDEALKRPFRTNRRISDKFNFLHISSCFPRKGVDVLLRSFWEEFGDDARVALTIKTFDNPHNEIFSLLDSIVGYAPSNISILKENLSPAAIFALYDQADCLVAPSRGEGFLLPAAEAMALGVPVITTDAGGQSDFCDWRTAWLVDSTISRAQSHMNLKGSYWFEPDVGSLRRRMREVVEVDYELILSKTRVARQRIEKNYTWDKVAKRYIAATLDIVLSQVSGPQPFKLPRLAVVTTWNQACGIATYSEQLVSELSKYFDISIVSEKVMPVEQDDFRVVRTWTRSSDGAFAAARTVAQGGFDAVLIQHHPGHFGWADLAKMIEEICADDDQAPHVFCQLHSTARQTNEIVENMLSFAKIKALFVHTFDDLCNLGEVVKRVRAVLVPHGIPVPNKIYERSRPFTAKKSGNKFKIGSFGFCMPHKGILTHLTAIGLVRHKIPNLYVTLLHSINDDVKTLACGVDVLAGLSHLRLNDIVDIDFSFLERKTILDRLSDCDLIVLPYRENMESASGAAREVAGLGVPILTTPATTLMDISSFSFQTKGYGALELADQIYHLASSPKILRSRLAQQREYAAANSWSSAAEKIWNVIHSSLRERRS